MGRAGHLLTGTVREQAEKVSSIVKDQTDAVADCRRQAEKASIVRAGRQAEVSQASRPRRPTQEQADQAEQAEKEQARQARSAERAAAKEAQAKAREPYEGLTKAELSDQLAERGLPKSGNVEELIERLVSADSE